MFSFTEYYRKRLLEHDENINNIINNYKKEKIINNKKRKYVEILDEKQSKTKTN
jgi:hypothetical protein